MTAINTYIVSRILPYTMAELAPSGHTRLVVYSDDRWSVLEQLRSRSKAVMKYLVQTQYPCYVYGSVARGDVSPSSDIDIIITEPVPSYLLLQVLDRGNQTGNQTGNYAVIDKRIVMATPNHAIKGQITLPHDITVSFPLLPLKPRELEFYDFGGKLSYDQLVADERVVGVDKSLLVIEPTTEGHHQRSLLGLSSAELTSFGISQKIVKERKRVLQRRRQVGRTGVFLDEPVDPVLGFEGTLKQIRDRNNLVRRRMNQS